MPVTPDQLYDWQRRLGSISTVLRAGKTAEGIKFLEALEGDIFGTYVDAVKESLGSDTEPPAEQVTTAE